MKKSGYQAKQAQIPFRLKEVGDDGIIEGHASTFGNRDLDDETFRRGAFKKTLQESGGIIPILDSHNRYEPIGWNREAEETNKGLRVLGELDIKNNPRAQAKFAWIKRALELGAKFGFGLSIGFRPIKWERDEDNDLLTFTEVILLEYSVVTFAANPMAMITGAKSLIPFFDLPVSSQEHSWDHHEARDRIREWSGSNEEPNEKYRHAFLWYDRDNPEKFESYRLPIADVIDGELEVIPSAVLNAAKLIDSGDLDIPEADIVGIKKHLGKYFLKMNVEPTWKQKESPLIEQIKSVISLADESIVSGDLSESEMLTLSELYESLRTLVEPSKGVLEDTLQAVKALTSKIRAA